MGRRSFCLHQLEAMSQRITVINQDGVMAHNSCPAGNTRHDRGVATDLRSGLNSAVEEAADDALVNEGILLESSAQALSNSQAQTMLTSGIHKSNCQGVDAFKRHPKVTEVGEGQAGGIHQGQAALFSVAGSDFLIDEALRAEVFCCRRAAPDCRGHKPAHHSDTDRCPSDRSFGERCSTGLCYFERPIQRSSGLGGALQNVSGEGMPTGCGEVRACIHKKIRLGLIMLMHCQ